MVMGIVRISSTCKVKTIWVNAGQASSGSSVRQDLTIIKPIHARANQDASVFNLSGVHPCLAINLCQEPVRHQPGRVPGEILRAYFQA